ncbi:MAG: TetR family transcriptional regulator, partial [Gemmatimonadales bacterium]|nr:TetR family transcriptional regulator [Gemmatimonadales bacterium]
MSPEVTQEYTEFRRRQILVAAWQAFAEKGVRGTTMRDIAEALGLSTGVVYTYFDGKEEIVRALLARSLDQNERLLEDLAQKESVTQAVEGLFDYFLQCCPGDAFRNSAQA